MYWRDDLAIDKDPNAVLDYQWSWADWLAAGEAIASHTVVAETGITVDSSVADSNAVTVWLSGGTAGESYEVTVRVTTNNVTPRTDDRSVTFVIAER